MHRHLTQRLWIFVAFCTLISGAALADSSAAPRGKLPAGVTPSSYSLTLEIDPRKTDFSGVADIQIKLDRSASLIWLHGRDLKVSKVSVRAGSREIPARYTAVDTRTGVSRLDASAEIPAGSATLHFEYTGKIGSSAEGLYRVQVDKNWYVYSQMEPIDARRVFPSFDEPGFKTPFDITVISPKEDKVVSNTFPTRSTASGAGSKHEFERTLPLPTYLLAFAVGPLDIVAAPPIPPNALRKTPLPFRGVSPQGQGAKLDYALRYSPEFVTRLESYLGAPFPYQKLDLIASPNMPGDEPIS